MTTPTNIGREWVTDRADTIDALIAKMEVEVKCILDERCYQNGIRGAATQLRAKIEDVEALVLKLRKAIHDDFGTPATEPEADEENLFISPGTT